MGRDRNDAETVREGRKNRDMKAPYAKGVDWEIPIDDLIDALWWDGDHNRSGIEGTPSEWEVGRLDRQASDHNIVMIKLIRKGTT